jgi:hypothetical protein
MILLYARGKRADVQATGRGSEKKKADKRFFFNDLPILAKRCALWGKIAAVRVVLWLLGVHVVRGEGCPNREVLKIEEIQNLPKKCA